MSELVELLPYVLLTTSVLINIYLLYRYQKDMLNRLAFHHFLLLHPYALLNVREVHEASGCPACTGTKKTWEEKHKSSG